MIIISIYLILVLCTFIVYKIIKFRKAHPPKPKSTKILGPFNQQQVQDYIAMQHAIQPENLTPLLVAISRGGNGGAGGGGGGRVYNGTAGAVGYINKGDMNENKC